MFQKQKAAPAFIMWAATWTLQCIMGNIVSVPVYGQHTAVYYGIEWMHLIYSTTKWHLKYKRMGTVLDTAHLISSSVHE